MGRMTKRLLAVFDRLVDFLALLAATAIVIGTASICLEVFMRGFFSRPLKGIVDINELILLYVTFLAATWLLRSEGHVTVGIAFDRLTAETQRLVNIITSSLGTGVCLMFAWWGGTILWQHFQEGILVYGGIHYPKWVVLAPIPVCCFLLAVQFARRTYGYLMTWLSARKEQELPIGPRQEGGR